MLAGQPSTAHASHFTRRFWLPLSAALCLSGAEMTDKKWIFILKLFFILFFIKIISYVAGIAFWRNGLISNIIDFTMYIELFILYIYPFIKGFYEIKSSNIRFGFSLVLFGILVPIASGYLSILLIEVLKKYPNIENKHNKSLKVAP